VEGQVHSVHGGQPTARNVELDAQVPDFEHGRGRHEASPTATAAVWIRSATRSGHTRVV
jgi:hypothetical protein